jgi:hypothetical protein
MRCRYPEGTGNDMLRMAISVILLCGAATAPAFAQADVRNENWTLATTLAGFAGVAADADMTGPEAGGAIGWELTPRFAIEGSGSWIEFGGSRTGFAGALKLRTRLAGERKMDPFVEAGVGLFRASFGPHDAVPGFYRRRMPATTGTLGAAFTDPTVVAGAGVTLFLKREIAIRPAVEATMAIRGGRTHVVTAVALHGVYYFEHRPVTPARGK